MKFLLPKELRGSFTKSVTRPTFLLTLFVLLIAGNWLARNFLFEPPAKWLGDYLLRTRDRAEARVTRIVRIDEESHQQIFDGRSPVDGAALVNAISVLAKSAPAVVVVDIDTASEQSFPPGFRLPAISVPVVWAVDADWEPAQQGLRLMPGRVVGGRLPNQPLFGIARMPLGFDGMVRGWERSIVVNGFPEPSLPLAAVTQYCSQVHDCDEARDTSFSREYLFAKIALGEYISRCVPSASTSCPTSGIDPRLTGKIVVLGGFHSHADRHDTPWAPSTVRSW